MAKGRIYRQVLPDRAEFTGRRLGEGVENKALAVWQAGCTKQADTATKRLKATGTNR